MPGNRILRRVSDCVPRKETPKEAAVPIYQVIDCPAGEVPLFDENPRLAVIFDMPPQVAVILCSPITSTSGHGVPVEKHS